MKDTLFPQKNTPLYTYIEAKFVCPGYLQSNRTGPKNSFTDRKLHIFFFDKNKS